ncbi:hypothetical protein ES705_31957 [subsurface metagenome]
MKIVLIIRLLAVLLLITIGVRLRAVRTTRGTSTSTVAASPTTVRAARPECVLFGLFNNLTI